EVVPGGRADGPVTRRVEAAVTAGRIRGQRPGTQTEAGPQAGRRRPNRTDRAPFRGPARRRPRRVATPYAPHPPPDDRRRGPDRLHPAAQRPQMVVPPGTRRPAPLGSGLLGGNRRRPTEGRRRMIIELHSIQNIAPSNLNRDDTGSPKDCTFGGVRRARISSQALKRAARKAFLSYGLTPEEVGVRTRRVAEAVVDRLERAHGRDREAATKVAENALAYFELTGGKYLLFVSRQGIEALADRCNDLFDELSKDKPTKGAIKELSADILLDASGQVDVALFGRMVAKLPNANVDAASQVAHAISTHEVRPEFDYFTAVDDLQEESPERETGAGHIDTLEFNSA